VSAGVFHDFHYSWVLEIKRALRRGLLPPGYYVMAEQLTGDLGGPDVITLQARDGGGPGGATALAEAPATVEFHASTPLETFARQQRSLVIRHTSGDRIVAIIEVVSPGNKASRHALRSFLDKLVAALSSGIHVLVVDIHRPGPRDPQGIHGALWDEIAVDDYQAPADRPLTAVAYAAGALIKAHIQHFSVGAPLPDMPVFLTPDFHVRLPLEASYLAAWDDVPPQYQRALEAPP
jgi:hypothetical protein